MSTPNTPHTGGQPQQPYQWGAPQPQAQSSPGPALPVAQSAASAGGGIGAKAARRPGLFYLAALAISFVSAFAAIASGAVYTGLTSFTYTFNWWGNVTWEARGLGAQQVSDEFAETADTLSGFAIAISSATMLALIAAAILGALGRRRGAGVAGLVAGGVQLLGLALLIADIAGESSSHTEIGFWLWLMLSVATLFFSRTIFKSGGDPKRRGHPHTAQPQ